MRIKLLLEHHNTALYIHICRTIIVSLYGIYGKFGEGEMNNRLWIASTLEMVVIVNEYRGTSKGNECLTASDAQDMVLIAKVVIG